MIKKYRYLIFTLVLILVYGGIQSGYMIKNKLKTNDVPTITFEQSELNVSVKTNEKSLLKGVKAFDKQDGDISNNVMIENYSIFLDNQTRLVNYVVFDSDGNVAQASRMIHYDDYQSPKFHMKDQLRDSSYSTTKVTDIVKAYSSVDGDISNNITIMNTSFIDKDTLELKLSVSDSTNTTSYLTLHYYLDDDYDIEIVLEDYLIYLQAGESFNYRSNVINVVEKLYQNIGLVEEIDIQIPLMKEPGVYEVIYSISRSNGNHGKATMVVVVE